MRPTLPDTGGVPVSVAIRVWEVNRWRRQTLVNLAVAIVVFAVQDLIGAGVNIGVRVVAIRVIPYIA